MLYFSLASPESRTVSPVNIALGKAARPIQPAAIRWYSSSQTLINPHRRLLIRPPSAPPPKSRHQAPDQFPHGLPPRLPLPG